MRYISTRNRRERVTAAQAIVRGISAEGGLFVPESLPPMPLEDIAALAGLPYAGRAAAVLAPFLEGFTAQEIAGCTSAAYGGNFRDPAVAPLRRLADGVHMLELWHGPTCAFKDMALQILPHLMRESAAKEAGGKTIVILVATSGDTGKAALEGFRDAERTKILVFYPEDGVSAMQKRQMMTQEGGNVSVCAVRGNFDDCQNGVKALFTDPALLRRLESGDMLFSSANSINWGRLAPQIVYYLSAYADLAASGGVRAGDPVNFVVPTGNFGNILAAYYAREMGLPVGRLICASNRNRVLADFIETGVYDRNRDFYATSSPSMDILISSNLERLLFELSGRDDGLVGRLMTQLKDTGRYEVPGEMKARLQALFSGGWCDDGQTAAAIRRVYEQTGYLCDTHTAVAVHVYEEYRRATGDAAPAVIVSTANPYKFADSVMEAVNPGAALPADEFELAEALGRLTGCPVPEPIRTLKDKPVRFTDVCGREDMERAAIRLLGL